ncbi:hypothetical protein ACFY00_09260 [Kitasatospora sp. NPDC001540]|uniref:hypothetical protein n=1 Tax=Kitasatospora sp. NPDC001540 TaxID=3364014 RepID=UPI00369C66B4
MRRATIVATVIGVAVAVTGCSSSGSHEAPATTPAAKVPSRAAADTAAPQPAPAAPRDAKLAVAALTTAAPTIKAVKTYTVDDDPNHLLGRPHQYISKTAFTDARIQAADVTGEDEDSVARGGSVEVFATEADAKARVDYIAGVIKNMPVFTEYDYVHGTEVLRVSKFLTPAQAEGLEAALKG